MILLSSTFDTDLKSARSAQDVVPPHRCWDSRLALTRFGAGEIADITEIAPERGVA